MTAGSGMAARGLSLQARLLMGLALIAAVAIAVAVAVTMTTQSYLVSQLDDRLEAFAGPPHEEGYTIAEYVLPSDLATQAMEEEDEEGDDEDEDGDESEGDDEFEEWSERPSEALSGLLYATGQFRVVRLPNVYGDDALAKPVFDVDALSTTERTYITVDTDGEHHYRVLAEPLIDGWEITALSTEGVDEAVARLVLIEVAGIGALIAGLGLVAWWVIRLGVTPMRRLVDASSAIAAGDLEVRLDALGGGREAAELGASLDVMVGKLTGALAERERSEGRLREFVADASHELRTPLTTVLGYAQLFRKGGLTGKADQDDAWRRTEAEAGRMKRLVEDMLELARYDAEPRLHLAPTDVTALVAEVLADAGRAYEAVTFAVAEAPGGITPVESPNVVATADADKLRQAVINVVTNAAQHGATHVSVAVTRGSDSTKVVVVDNGPGMSPDVAARATERFVRGDGSRSRATGGAGLGLAITAAIVEAHGGTLSLTSEVGRGTTVTLEWLA